MTDSTSVTFSALLAVTSSAPRSGWGRIAGRWRPAALLARAALRNFRWGLTRWEGWCDRGGHIMWTTRTVIRRKRRGCWWCGLIQEERNRPVGDRLRPVAPRRQLEQRAALSAGGYWCHCFTLGFVGLVGPVPANFLRCGAGPGERWVWCLCGGAVGGAVGVSGGRWCG